MLERFFMSRTRIQLLTIFLTNPEKEYYIRELARMTGITLPSISQEIKNLEAADFVRGIKRGKSLFYQVNKTHPLYTELKSIIYKTTALGDVLRDALAPISGIDAVLIYGSIAKDTERRGSDIDILIIGTPDEDAIYRVISEMEEKTNREINAVTFSAEEWCQKLVEKSSFALSIVNQKTIPLIGSIDVISDTHK